MRRIVCVIMSCLLLASCREADVVLKVTDQVINSDYIGNGAEWDPYDEAIVWEASSIGTLRRVAMKRLVMSRR